MEITDDQHRLSELFPEKPENETFDILAKLNTGSFGATFLIRDSSDGQMYLLKRIDQSIPERFRQRLANERIIFNLIKSNWILSLISAYLDVEHRCYMMKFSYLNGLTLDHLVRHHRWLEESAVAFYAAQLVLALEYLHEFNLIYRNLKLETILLTATGYIKLSDFAFAKLLPSRSSVADSIIGVPDTIPPEMLLGRPYSFSVDWWQLGVAMFEMFTGRSPFFAPSMLETHRNVLCQRRLEFPSHLSNSARQTCRIFLERNVRRRLGCSSSGLDAKEVRKYPWFEQHVDWTSIIEQSCPSPYPIKSFFHNRNEMNFTLNTFESKWLDEYDQVVRSLMDIRNHPW